MNKAESIYEINKLASEGKQFLFIIDYEMNTCMVLNPDEAFSKKILFDFNGIKNYQSCTNANNEFKFEIYPIKYSEYLKSFDYIQTQLKTGNSYLVNLTFPTRIETDLSLNEIFHKAKAKYKLLYKDQFVFFSPEIFIKTNNGRIFTYPMKGTIDASISDAKNELLNNEKEKAEHATIVDLLRNDLSIVANNVKVEKFRYIDKIETNNKSILQASSVISGDLSEEYKNKPADLIFKMLPAGSITGAPKNKTIEIINKAENYKRGFYTGIAGFFNGREIDSCVNIRYIENQDGKLIYKSGGGITSMSNAQEEYTELINKIYVPFN
ncbi:MAG: aminodeoxychorismate synthase component I [Prolixibacteraceae bacterium]|nr:aminodeoxychorismate synthase component I [Prolixibacteraceae bacterium]